MCRVQGCFPPTRSTRKGINIYFSPTERSQLDERIGTVREIMRVERTTLSLFCHGCDVDKSSCLIWLVFASAPIQAPRDATNPVHQVPKTLMPPRTKPHTLFLLLPYSSGSHAYKMSVLCRCSSDAMLPSSYTCGVVVDVDFVGLECQEVHNLIQQAFLLFMCIVECSMLPSSDTDGPVPERAWAGCSR